MFFSSDFSRVRCEITFIWYLLLKSKFSFYFILLRRFTVNQLTLLKADPNNVKEDKGVFVTEYLDQSIVIGTNR